MQCPGRDLWHQHLLFWSRNQCVRWNRDCTMAMDLKKDTGCFEEHLNHIGFHVWPTMYLKPYVMLHIYVTLPVPSLPQVDTLPYLFKLDLSKHSSLRADPSSQQSIEKRDWVGLERFPESWPFPPWHHRHFPLVVPLLYSVVSVAIVWCTIQKSRWNRVPPAVSGTSQIYYREI